MPQHPIEVDHHGMTLRGTVYRPAATGRFPTVLLLHGFTGQRIETGFLFVRLARRLAEQGLAAVTFDFLHSGESDGTFEQMLVTGEVADAMHITHWLQGQPFVDRSRLGLLGFSLGGLVAACTVGRTEVYRSLVLIAPTTVPNFCRFAGQVDGSPSTVHGPYELHPHIFEDVRTLHPMDDCVRHPRPTLLVQGTEDAAVPPEVSHRYTERMRQANVPLETLEIDGANHTFGAPAWRRRLFQGVGTFLTRTLGRPLGQTSSQTSAPS